MSVYHKMQSSEKIFEKMIRRLYKTNICLSNLIFLPFISPNFHESVHAFCYPFFPGCMLPVCVHGVDAPANRRGVFGDERLNAPP